MEFIPGLRGKPHLAERYGLVLNGGGGEISMNPFRVIGQDRNELELYGYPDTGNTADMVIAGFRGIGDKPAIKFFLKSSVYTELFFEMKPAARYMDPGSE